MKLRLMSFEVVGDSPLLMHKLTVDIYRDKNAKSKGKGVLSDEDYAELHAYRSSKSKELIVPADCLKECLKIVSKQYGGVLVGTNRKVKSIYPMFCGSTFIEPEELGLGVEKYEINLAIVRIGKDRIVRARALVWPWDLSFKVKWIEEMLPTNFANFLPDIVNEGGMVIGLLDRRPAKGGSFGRFHVTEYRDEGYAEAAKVKAKPIVKQKEGEIRAPTNGA